MNQSLDVFLFSVVVRRSVAVVNSGSQFISN